MKKKSIAAVSCIMVVVMLLLTGCGGNNGETGGDKDSGKLSPYQLSSSEKQLAMMMVGSTAPVMIAGFEGAKDYKEMNTGVEYYEHGKLVNGKSGTKMTCDLTDLGDDSGEGHGSGGDRRRCHQAVGRYRRRVHGKPGQPGCKIVS